MPGQTIQVFVLGFMGKTLTYTLQEDSLVAELFEGVCRDTRLSEEMIHLIYGIKELQIRNNGISMTLQDYGIGNLSNLTFYVSQLGGSDNVGLQEGKVLGDDVELTYDPDMITLDDDPNSPRAKMPCGHSIGPESLTAFCRSLLSEGKYEFKCPFRSPYCGEIWEYITVRKLGVLSPAEQKEFEIKISDNYLRKSRGIQECPKCCTLCQRRDKKNPRVVCIVCSNGQTSRYEFCWYCRKVWSTSGTKDCGNPSCDGTDNRLKQLKRAEIKDIWGVKCPALRACPKCGLLILHQDQCKHMLCVCGQNFCFICLKISPCNFFDPNCKVAATQEVIPGE